MMMMRIQQQLQQEEEELNQFKSLYHLAELSAYKLNSPLRPRTEPTLRRQLLVRNLLEMSARLIINQPKQEEELWLDACIDQLENYDEVMEEQIQHQDQQQQKENKIVLLIPLGKKQNNAIFQCNL
ncbi:hypothetical protein K501DRAFT_281407 [Backusella circina FSU 941]|nr:hypothetical protein K501DRAFT_281407 [Backusella circina FSU 941]